MTTDGVAEREAARVFPPVRGGPPESRRRRAPVARAIVDETERIESREVAEALGKLETRGDLTATQRAAVREMADAIVRGLLASPIECLSRTTDYATVERALRLFEAEVEPRGDPQWQDRSIPVEVNDDD